MNASLEHSAVKPPGVGGACVMKLYTAGFRPRLSG